MNDVLPVLQEFYREALGRLVRHQASARVIRQYDVNNTYQYIINREEAHLSWVARAITELGGSVDDTAEPALTERDGRSGKGTDPSPVLTADAREAGEFVERWRARVAALPNARHAKMLDVILGEVLEQQRFFEQALAGRTDLLGRRGEQLEPSHGDVLATRWIE